MFQNLLKMIAAGFRSKGCMHKKQRRNEVIHETIHREGGSTGR